MIPAGAGAAGRSGPAGAARKGRRLPPGGLVLAFLLAGSLAAWGQGAPEIINFDVAHTPPTEAAPGRDLRFEASISPSGLVAYAQLNWRVQGAPRYRPLKMVHGERDRFTAVLPGREVQAPGVEYFLSVVDVRGGYHRVYRDERTPIQISVTRGKAGAEEFGAAMQEEFALFAAEDIVVGAAKHEQKVGEAPAAVAVVPSEVLHNSGAQTIPQALRVVPGVEVYDVDPGYSLVGIRGFSNTENNLIVATVDGREVNDPLFGAVFWELLPVTLDDIDRIEVIRGPGSALYGANAFAGVVNITTKTPEKARGLSASLFGGTPAADGAQVRYGSVVGNAGYLVSAGHRSFDAWPANVPGSGSVPETQGNVVNSTLAPDAQQLYAADSGRLAVTYHVADKVDLSFDGYGGQGRSRYFHPLSPIEMGTSQGGGKLAANLYGGTVQLNYSHLGGKFRFLDPTLDGMLNNAPFSLNSDQLDGYAHYDLDLGRWSRVLVGGDARLNSFNSPQFVPDPLTGSLTVHETLIGGFVQDEVRPIDSVLLNAGARYDYFSTGSAVVPFSPRASLTFTPIQGHSLRASYSHALKKPTFLEYGFDLAGVTTQDQNQTTTRGVFAGAASDHNIRNYTQQINSVEVGYVGRPAKAVKVDLTGYTNSIQNAIVYDLYELRYESSQGYSTWTNATAFGGEASVEWAAIEGLTLYANYCYQILRSDSDVIRRDASGNPLTDPNTGDLLYTARKGEALKEAPKNKAGVGVNTKIGSWSGGLWFNYYDPRVISEFRNYTANGPQPSLVLNSTGNYVQSPDTDPATRVPATVLLSLRAAYRFWEDRAEVGLNGYNLLGASGVRQYAGVFWQSTAPSGQIVNTTYGGEQIATRILGTFSVQF